ncbi:MAG TPA: ATP-grasp domain-containing protein [Candidatus Dormibacteraeota bacterium]|nr:ATP-grasp domain-containing protein [Candidatus Dormibacteraeota bacterium]
MDARNKMTRLLEHQGKTLLRNAGIRVPAGDVATSPKDVKEIAEKIKYPVVIKAQVSATGRFKAGGLMFAGSPAEAEVVAERILGSTVKGFLVEKALVEEKLDVEKEFYASVIVDDSHKVKAPVLMVSTRGGIDLEQVALEHPGEVRRRTVNILDGLNLDNVEEIVAGLNISGSVAKQFAEVALRVYDTFRKYHARSVEINPIVLTADGLIYAADCRIVLDEASVSKHPELGIDFPRDIGRPPTELEKLAWQIEANDYRGIGYFIQMTTEIKPDEDYVGFHGIGGGGAMIGADALIRHGLKIANYADTSGNPTPSKVYRIVKIIFSQPNIVGYALMGPVIANQEQWHHANPIVRALREELRNRPDFPVIILIAGNKEKEAIEILREHLAGLPARIEIYGRDYVYNVDFVAQRMRELVDEYKSKAARGMK